MRSNPTSPVCWHTVSPEVLFGGPPQRKKERNPQFWREPKRALLLCELPVLQSCCGFEVTSATLMESFVKWCSCDEARTRFTGAHPGGLPPLFSCCLAARSALGTQGGRPKGWRGLSGAWPLACKAGRARLAVWMFGSEVLCRGICDVASAPHRC